MTHGIGRRFTHEDNVEWEMRGSTNWLGRRKRIAPMSVDEEADDGSSQVTLTLEVVLKNSRMTPAQRRMVHRFTRQKALELQAMLVLASGEGNATVRSKRASSLTGEYYFDLASYQEDDDG